MGKRKKQNVKSAVECKADAQKIAFAPVVFQAARILRDSGILSYINSRRHEGAKRKEISEKTGFSEYAVRVLLESGMVSDLVYEEDGRFFITKTGYFILNDRMTKVNMDFINDVCYRGMRHLEESLREKRPAGLSVFGKWPTIYEGLSELPENVQKSWYDFDHFYSDGCFSDALEIVFKSKPKKLLDVGGNTGRWALRCLKYSDDVHVTIMDHGQQIESARKNIGARGFGDRIDGFPSDLLDHTQPFPTGYDAIWMSQFLDCFGEKDIEGILKRARLAMDDDSRLFILETFWDRQRFEASKFCVVNTSLYFTCMANGNSRMYHSEDMIKCVENSGLNVEEQVDGIGVGHTMLICRKS